MLKRLASPIKENDGCMLLPLLLLACGGSDEPTDGPSSERATAEPTDLPDSERPTDEPETPTSPGQLVVGEPQP